MSQQACRAMTLCLLPCIVMGCHAPRWDHPTQSMESLEHDRSDCVSKATLEVMETDPHTGVGFDKQEAVNQCLMKKGYIQRSQD